MRLRHEERDPLTFEQFLKQDRNEEKTFNISHAGRLADYALNNDGSLEDLHRAIDELVARENLLS